MRKPTEARPPDVSKALFMDLAFLLIAALVLLVREPTQESREPNISVIGVRSVAVREVVEENIPGESIFVRVEVDGGITEVLPNNVTRPLSTHTLESRIAQMQTHENRVVVLIPEANVPYAKIAKIRDVLISLQEKGIVTRLYEVVQGKP